MDFNRFGQNRSSNQNSAPANQPGSAKPGAPADVTAPAAANGNSGSGFKHSRAYRWSFLALLVSGTALFIATIFFIVFGTPINKEARYVETDKYQAVFVNVNGTNGGQVYFGKITDLNSQYIRLSNVFYIQNQATQDGQASGSYNLVKLGCELHGPTDEMLINRGEVFFWENLKNDSQVAQKAAEYYKTNGTGEQKCETNTGSTQQSEGTTQQPATNTTPTTQTQQQQSGNGTGTGNTTTTPSTNTNNSNR